MAFCRQMDNPGDMFFLHQVIDGIKITYIRFNEFVIRTCLNIFEVRQVAGIGEFIDIDDTVVGVFIDK